MFRQTHFRFGSGENPLPKSHRHEWLVLLVTCFAFSAPIAETLRDPERLREEIVRRFDASRVPLLDAWMGMVSEAAQVHREEDKLTRVNGFINSNLFFEDNLSIWGVPDHWATPLETIGQGRGDCEDFAIIKYISLRLAGIPSAPLRFVYVKVRRQDETGPAWGAHMVLAYYATPLSDPLILDNLNGAILPASKRSDLQPVFGFNGDGIFSGIPGKSATKVGGSRWEDIWQRIVAEGYF